MKFAFSFCLTLVCLFAWGQNVQAEEWAKHWKVGSSPVFHVTAGDASITVEVGANDEIAAVLRTRGVSIGDSGVRVHESQSGDTVELEIREPRQYGGFNHREIELHVKVPQRLSADLRTGDGSIRLTGVHGMYKVNTGDGSIEARDLDGKLDARTGDGSVRAAGRFDGLQLRTGDGSVDVEARQGSRMNAEWHIETGDGSVRLRVARDLAADVQLQTGDGSIHLDVPLAMQAKHGEHQVEGKLNGGGPLMSVRSGDGSINMGEL